MLSGSAQLLPSSGFGDSGSAAACRGCSLRVQLVIGDHDAYVCVLGGFSNWAWFLPTLFGNRTLDEGLSANQTWVSGIRAVVPLGSHECQLGCQKEPCRATLATREARKCWHGAGLVEPASATDASGQFSPASCAHVKRASMRRRFG